MTFHFMPAVRERVSLLIALAGASGSGKTMSALRLAKGMAPGGKIAFIDTEARRGLHYADQFEFMHADMRPPFRPQAFIEGIQAAEAAGAEVVIVDSFSNEYDGTGGIMDWADEIEAGGTKSPGNWKIPKREHKKMMQAFLQCRASLIFCLRADEKIKIVRENNKTQVLPMGWMPICEKRFMYEMTASFTLTPDNPGRPQFSLPHKLQQQHRAMFPEGELIAEQSGKLITEWARGGKMVSAPPAVDRPAPNPTSQGDGAGQPDEPSSDDLMAFDKTLADAAEHGLDALKISWGHIPVRLQPSLKSALDRRHKPRALAVDKAKEPA